MDAIPLKFRGRIFGDPEITLMTSVINANPKASRRKLSTLVCQAMDWRQKNGHWCDMVCRGVMLSLHRLGKITLPPVRHVSRNNVLQHRHAQGVLIDQTPLNATVAELDRIDIQQVRGTSDELLFNGLLLEHHYLGYNRPVGECLKYIIVAMGRPIACAAWSSAPRHLAPRDRFIGWPKETRIQNLHLIAYNTRFLILPWVHVPHLASHLLGRMAKTLSSDWQSLYGHPVYYLETFIDPQRFKGTCYRAANWTFLGKTSGLGHNSRTGIADQPVKEILGYPLTPKFRQLMGVAL